MRANLTRQRGNALVALLGFKDVALLARMTGATRKTVCHVLGTTPCGAAYRRLQLGTCLKVISALLSRYRESKLALAPVEQRAIKYWMLRLVRRAAKSLRPVRNSGKKYRTLRLRRRRSLVALLKREIHRI